MHNDLQPSSTPATGLRPLKHVYAIVERENAKSLWIRVGTAFTNRDGSLTLRLDALPVNGTLQVRDPDPRDDRNGRDARSGQ